MARRRAGAGGGRPGTGAKLLFHLRHGDGVGVDDVLEQREVGVGAAQKGARGMSKVWPWHWAQLHVVQHLLARRRGGRAAAPGDRARRLFAKSRNRPQGLLRSVSFAKVDKGRHHHAFRMLAHRLLEFSGGKAAAGEISLRAFAVLAMAVAALGVVAFPKRLAGGGVATLRDSHAGNDANHRKCSQKFSTLLP